MRIYPRNLLADAKEERRQGERAFTMVEIAIAIGVIGFALVAVIGILPTGMNAQKDNREDTVISQDAPFFIDAIRNGGTNVFDNNNNNISPIQGLDFLTNYVEKISILGITNTDNVTKITTNSVITSFGSGWEIVGLLSTPEGLYVSSNNYTLTRAIVRSMGGSAVEQNGANQATSFRYQMDVEIIPFVNVAPDSTNFNFYENVLKYAADSPEVLIRSNRWMEVNTGAGTNGSIYLQPASGELAYSCFDVRLHFSWPVLPGPNGTEVVGPGRQTFRTTIASAILASPLIINDAQLWFFQPQLYATQPTINFR
ncbi:MAG TPA: type II secretion system protein [Candidatus Baltobacteraceae bacterium]|jgi:type II secretory pathway pseudopilin PulG|nr:type II secretion system protein [Candidatus Baltobacteraceae bacterium]